MTTYSYRGIAPHIHVVNDDTGLEISGPYKNEESAKRRIRDLKRKEAANDTLVEAKVEQIKAVNITPATNPGKPSLNPSSGVGAQLIETMDGEALVVIADKFTIAPAGSGSTGLLAINKHGDVVRNPAITPNAFTNAAVDKLAMSSAYGIMRNPIATPAIASMDNYVPLRRAPITRPVGCYPHVSKRAYRLRRLP